MKWLKSLLEFIGSLFSSIGNIDPSAGLPDETVKPPVNDKPVVFIHAAKGFSKNQHKRRAPPKAFLDDLFHWIKNECPKFLYARNNEPRDVFSHLSSYLGVSGSSSLKYRQACLFELMRVSAAMESSFNWQEGRDMAASNTDYYEMESGIFQTSPNSHVYLLNGQYLRWTYLDELVAKHGVGRVVKGSQHCIAWNKLMKNESKKSVIFEHHAFMLRHNFRHYGPMIDVARVGENISKQCIAEIQRLL